METLKTYGINPSDRILAVRGNNVALDFPVEGSIIDEAKKHLDIEMPHSQKTYKTGASESPKSNWKT